MSDDPVRLDDHRSNSGRISANMRRIRLTEIDDQYWSLLRSHEELEAQLLADPAKTWPEAAAKAQFLIRRFANTADAEGALVQVVIERALGDLARLTERSNAAP